MRSAGERTADAGGRTGLALWFTGLPGSGKSTLSRAVAGELDASDRRIVTILDGDIVRQFLSQGVGFTRKDRYDNVCRIGYAASLIVRHGGIAIIAAVSPYRDARSQARSLVEDAGGVFFEIHMDTPFSACVARDPKGYYARALAGEVDLFTGVDDPYEKPLAPDIRVCTEGADVLGGVRQVMTVLRQQHCLCPGGRKTTG
ncbi:adenylyl-sulfate kinase [Acidiferrobacter sp.]|uniref:adenylyl-sulfate kinase n=1 Tax=Acidiferrobacter sp. TaxID=1872107 RepID=UPI00260704AA|nr:adenylyl-sulfate kinase [Acidiferrobacter sp.]